MRNAAPLAARFRRTAVRRQCGASVRKVLRNSQVGACGAAPDKGQNQNCLLEGVSDRPGTLVLSRTLFWEQVSDK